MTNALAKNAGTETVSDILLENFKTASNKNSIKEDKKSFSNILNNLDARTEKAKTNFIKDAKKSDLNSYAKNPINDIKEKNINKKEINRNENSLDEKEISKENQNIEKENNYNEKIEDKEEKNSIQEPKKETEKNSDNNLSDINNSSPVKSSPVFSSDSESVEIIEEKINDTLEKIDNLINELSTKMPITMDSENVSMDDIKNDIQDILDNQEISGDIKNIIENISNNLSTKDMTQEEKDNLYQLFDKFKNELKNIPNSKEIDNFNSTLDKLSNKIENVLSKLNINSNENLGSNTDKINNFEKENKIVNIKPKEEIFNDLNQKISEIENSFDELKLDNEEIKNIKNNLIEIKNKIDNIELNPINKEDLETLSNTLKNLKNLMKDSIGTIDEKLNNSDLGDNKINQKPIKFEKLTNILEKNNQDLTTEDKKIINEVVKILDKLNQNENNVELNEDVKKEIEKIISNSKNDNINIDELNKTIESLPKNIKDDFKKAFNEQNSTVNNETLEIQKNFKINNEQNNFTDNKQNPNDLAKNNQEVKLKTTLNTKELNSSDLKEVNLEGKIETEETKLQNTEKTHQEEKNIQKVIYNKEIMEDMVLEVDIKTIPSQSGALSSTDEVMKLALGEQNSLNPIATVHGNISYDNMNSNSIIKNVAMQMKQAQPQNTSAPSMDEVINQISNKLTQLKNNQGQRLTMILRPNDLGRLSIELTTNNLGLSTNILAQNEDVRMYIEKNIDSLRQQLSDAGVNVNNIQIKTMGQDNATTYDGNQNLTKENNQDDLSQQHKNQNQNQNNSQNKKDMESILTSMSNYDVQFAKDFDNVLNKSLSYSLN